ncbi:MAG: tetratricopeptide repeat protein [Pirellulaceae bacterium]|nr:tetratricopeptide repeat protein [Pirellulaceae bacterium]
MQLHDNATRALRRGDREAAIAAADQMVKLEHPDAVVYRLVGDIYLRASKPALAVEMFDRYLKKQPQALPELWQRGIALYFAGDYRRAAEQFQVHRRVNPNDVENAAWHFLCVAKAEDFEAAKKNVLPAPNDPRIPMAEVLELLKTGDTQLVIERVGQTPEGSRDRESAQFYGDVYLGLYADAKGNLDRATQWMERAAKDAPRHYMGDVARVYADYLREQAKATSQPPKR